MFMVQETNLLKSVAAGREWNGILPPKPGPSRLRAIRKTLALSLKRKETANRDCSPGKVARAKVLRKMADLLWPRTYLPKELMRRGKLE